MIENIREKLKVAKVLLSGKSSKIIENKLKVAKVELKTVA